jgi:hypothetical protein
VQDLAEGAVCLVSKSALNPSPSNVAPNLSPSNFVFFEDLRYLCNLTPNPKSVLMQVQDLAEGALPQPLELHLIWVQSSSQPNSKLKPSNLFCPGARPGRGRRVPGLQPHPPVQRVPRAKRRQPPPSELHPTDKVAAVGRCSSQASEVRSSTGLCVQFWPRFSWIR